MSDERWREKYYDKCDELSRFEIANDRLKEMIKRIIIAWDDDVTSPIIITELVNQAKKMVK